MTSAPRDDSVIIVIVSVDGGGAKKLPTVYGNGWRVEQRQLPCPPFGSERLNRRTILWSEECPILHKTYDEKCPSIQRQSYHPIKTLAHPFLENEPKWKKWRRKNWRRRRRRESALVSFKHQCSCRYSLATTTVTVCPSPSPRFALEERKEREKYRQWLLGQMSLFRDGSTQCPVSPVTRLYVLRTAAEAASKQLCIAAFSMLVFIRTSFGDKMLEAGGIPRILSKISASQAYSVNFEPFVSLWLSQRSK